MFFIQGYVVITVIACSSNELAVDVGAGHSFAIFIGGTNDGYEGGACTETNRTK